MHIVYAGDLASGGTCSQRLNALRRLGHEVHPVQIFPEGARNGIISKLRHRTLVGPGMGEINRRVLHEVRLHRPDILWIDKGIYLWPHTVRAAREFCRNLIHYNPDDPFGGNRWGWRLFLEAIGDYDLHFVPRDVNNPEYLAAGAKRVGRFQWAYEPTVHFPRQIDASTREQIGGPVGFVGNFEIERSRTLHAIATAGIEVRVWGSGWQRATRHPNLRLELRPLTGDAYAEAVSAFDINLCFLRKVNRDQSTTRSVEIPACGAFMLAERTEEHLKLFEEGVEASFFGSDGECIEKIGYYLRHADERRKIADAGRVRCTESGYSNDSRLARMLREVAALQPPPLSASETWR